MCHPGLPPGAVREQPSKEDPEQCVVDGGARQGELAEPLPQQSHLQQDGAEHRQRGHSGADADGGRELPG